MPIVIPAESGASAGDVYFSSVALNRVEPAAITASSAATGYPAANANDYLHPVRAWKPSGTGGEWVRYEFSSFFVPHIHVGWWTPGGAPSFTIQGDGDGTFTTPDFSEVVTVAEANVGLVGRYYYFYRATPAVKYIRVLYPSHSGAVPSLGRFLVLTTGGLLVTQRPPLRFGMDQSVAENRFHSGGREVIGLGPKRLILNFDWTWAYDYINAASGNENAVLFDSNLHGAADDPVLVVRDVAFLPNWSSLFWRMGSALEMVSQQGVGAQFSLAYEEVV